MLHGGDLWWTAGTPGIDMMQQSMIRERRCRRGGRLCKTRGDCGIFMVMVTLRPGASMHQGYLVSKLSTADSFANVIANVILAIFYTLYL